MAIKRYAICTCDGPCGTKIEGAKPPEGWTVISFRPTGMEKDSVTMALCLHCLSRLEALFSKHGFALFEVNRKVQVVTAHAAQNCPACQTVRCQEFYKAEVA